MSPDIHIFFSFHAETILVCVQYVFMMPIETKYGLCINMLKSSYSLNEVRGSNAVS